MYSVSGLAFWSGKQQQQGGSILPMGVDQQSDPNSGTGLEAIYSSWRLDVCLGRWRKMSIVVFKSFFVKYLVVLLSYRIGSVGKFDRNLGESTESKW